MHMQVLKEQLENNLFRKKNCTYSQILLHKNMDLQKTPAIQGILCYSHMF